MEDRASLEHLLRETVKTAAVIPQDPTAEEVAPLKEHFDQLALFEWQDVLRELLQELATLAQGVDADELLRATTEPVPPQAFQLVLALQTEDLHKAATLLAVEEPGELIRQLVLFGSTLLKARRSLEGKAK